MARTKTRRQLQFHIENPSKKPVRKVAHTPDSTAQLFELKPRGVLILTPHPSQLSLESHAKLSEPDYDDLRGSVRKLLTELLVFASGDPGARMCWVVTQFRDRIVLRYLLILIGWPSRIPFGDLSVAGAASAEHMRTLIKLMVTKKLYFAKATASQVRAARLAAGGISPGPLYDLAIPHPSLGRSNIGRRHPKHDSEGCVIPSRYVRDGPKSVKVIEAAEDEVVETHTLPRTSGPLPQLHNQFAHMAWHKTGWQELRVDPKESELSDDISEFTDTE